VAVALLIGPPPMETDRDDPLQLLTLRQVAELLRVSKRTVERLISRKELSALMIGGQRRISASQLAKWIEGLHERSVA
jgi:excisionase family DNA binding protein